MSDANSATNSPGWFADFLRHELAPYPGRLSVVARMIIAAVLSMILIVTFRIPYGAIGVNCAFILSREDLVSTAKSGFYFILAFAAWAMLTPIGARMFASVPITHFLWEAITVFLCFYILKAVAYFPLAAGLVVVATGTLAIWYLPGPAEANVEFTLWQILATSIGAAVTILVEVTFHYFSPSDPVRDGLCDRLRSLEAVLVSPSPEAIGKQATTRIEQYAMTGTSQLREQIARSDEGPFDRSRWSTLIALVGRCIDVGAALAESSNESPNFGALDTMRARIEAIRLSIKEGVAIAIEERPSHQFAGLLAELDQTVTLTESVLTLHSAAQPGTAGAKLTLAHNSLFVADAFFNPDYLRFALAGTATAMTCYIIYVGLHWPGIATAVTTCVLTALSDIGSSRQKQILRIGGAAFGGLVFGLGSQIFVLPYIDSVVGLALLFAIVTGISAYVATSSPRLSYAGLQMAFAFYLINVTDFSISLDLTIGRDRALGVLLGIVAMWLIFEPLYHRPAAPQMLERFIRSIRLVADLAPTQYCNQDWERIQALRHDIPISFAGVSAEADAVLFETGRDRETYLQARTRIKSWLNTLRMIYLLELHTLPITNGPSTGAPGITGDARPPKFAWAASLMRAAEALECRNSRSAKARDAFLPGEHEPEPEATLDDPTLQRVTQLAGELEREILAQPLLGREVAKLDK